MSEPEIARRCNTCGASVRGAAHFCPQCGQPLAGASVVAAPAQTKSQPALVDEAERVAMSLSGKLTAPRDAGDARASNVPDVPDTANAPEASTAAQPAPPAMVDDARVLAEDGARANPASVQATGIAGASVGRLRQRAASVGAGVGETLRPRAQKLRERSVVVLDEAADDPGLRFVLVAAALFVVALLLFIFSFALR
jgi:hypothetical protein